MHILAFKIQKQSVHYVYLLESLVKRDTYNL